MSRVVVAHCPTHGQMDVPLCFVSLHLCKDGANRSYYQFPCQACGLVLRAPATLLAATNLMGAGIIARCWSVPAEALEQHAGPALTLDDLISLHEEINAPGWCAA